MRDIKTSRYVLAAVLTAVIFTLGILFSNFIDDVRSDSLRTELQDDVLAIESRQMQLSLLESDHIQSCDVLETGLTNIIGNYNQNLDRVLNYKENSFFNEKDFETIRRRYILSGVRYWMFAQELRDKCDYTTNTFLFFSQDEDCKNCSRTGTQLTLLKKKYQDLVLTFLVPTNIEDGTVKILKDKYNVTSVPTVVINGNTKLEGYVPIEQLERNIEYPNS